MADFTWLDYIIFFIFLVGTLSGLARGIVRELISLIAIIVALIITIKFTMSLTYFLYFTKGSRDVIAFIARFVPGGDWSKYLSLFTLDLSVLLLFVGSMSIAEAVNSYMLPNTFMSSALSLVYRLTGAAVGFIRGTIFNVVFILILTVSPITQDPAWTGSSLVPRLMGSVKLLGERIEPNGFGKFPKADQYR